MAGSTADFIAKQSSWTFILWGTLSSLHVKHALEIVCFTGQENLSSRSQSGEPRPFSSGHFSSGWVTVSFLNTEYLLTRSCSSSVTSFLSFESYFHLDQGYVFHKQSITYVWCWMRVLLWVLVASFLVKAQASNSISSKSLTNFQQRLLPSNGERNIFEQGETFHTASHGSQLRTSCPKWIWHLPAWKIFPCSSVNLLDSQWTSTEKCSNGIYWS